MNVRSTGWSFVLCASLAVLTTARPARAYNDQQHQGMVAIAYKAMVAAALEDGCAPPVDFKGATPSAGITDLPDATVCGPNTAVCQADWAEFLRQSERGMRFLRGVDAGLERDDECPIALDYTGTLGEVPFGVGTEYARSGGCDVVSDRIHPAGEKDRRCSSPALLCHDESIYRFLAPDDHTGDLLGFWATEPDHDPSTTAVGFKPINPLIGKGMQALDEIAEDTLGAALLPFVCGIKYLLGDDEGCADDARSLADSATPIDEINGAVPVLFSRHDDDFLGLWHFMGVHDTDSPCDDVRGMFYERAGPGKVPDALDLLIIIGTDLGMQYLSYDDSTGARLFSLTDPGDGDQPSCSRDRVDWEGTSLGHTLFSPVDNLGFFGWKEFALASTRQAHSLGWPLHALGDAAAPHHVLGTTGWGHRPFEDSAERNWNRILYQDVLPVSELRLQQYAQLRRILVQGFAYWRRLDELRSGRPTSATFNAIPLRAFITEVARDTLATVTTPDGFPLWPLDPTLSVPYFAGLQDETIEQYTDVDDVVRTRALLERGSASMVAFLTSIGQLGAPYTPASVCGTAGATFPDCGESSDCTAGCCAPSVPVPSSCQIACDHSECTGTFCKSSCPSGRSCDPNNCCVATACDEDACADNSDCDPASSCIGGCCGPVVR